MYILLLFLINTIRVAGDMPIQVSNIQQGGGQLMVAVFDRPDAFMDENKAVFKQAYPVSAKGSRLISVPAIGNGTYAISCYHDQNGNGKLDKNLMGIPSEPYGFSQGARPKFRAPTWEEAKIYFSGQTINVVIAGW